jgi:nitroimidazol reductase NimA-like FMN-containing flavoprotein (pyridoxamine 5'-phosphate oxidase superfamily)
MTQHEGPLQVESIERDECLALLDSHAMGRLGMVVGNQPLTFPLYYMLDGTNIVFRSDRGLKVHSAIGQRVAFEIDSPGDANEPGWSVLVIGTAELVESPAAQHRLEQLGTGAWNPGPKDHWVRVHADAISGRRIVRHHITPNA